MPAPTPPFYYLETDPNPPGGVTGYPMTPNNLAPALVVWLYLTTNTQWPVQISQDAYDEILGTPAEIAAALGVTEGTVQFIFDLAKDSNNLQLFKNISRLFQSIKDCYQGGVGNPPPYRPPCPPMGSQILQLAPSAWTPNPGAPVTAAQLKVAEAKQE
jgi:hypothetical protein